MNQKQREDLYYAAGMINGINLACAIEDDNVFEALDAVHTMLTHIIEDDNENDAVDYNDNILHIDQIMSNRASAE